MMNFLKLFLLVNGLIPIVLGCSSLPEVITAWKKTNGSNMAISTNVQKVSYSNDYVYVYATSIPEYTIGPWPNQIYTATDAKLVLKYPRNPTVATKKTAVPMGHIGQMYNGVVFFNPKDAVTYNNLGIWSRSAYFWEGNTFDNCGGHPSPSGEYHNHVDPSCFYTKDSSKHSPLLGFMFDGYPIYGPYAYSSANVSSSSIARMKSSYRIRNIANRTTLANGTVLQASQYGPAINSTYPLGSYIEDHEYVQGLGDLDEHNGRYCVTPEFPNGIYAYFITVNSTGQPEYPFIIGPYYYGEPVQSNLTPQPTTVSETVTVYFTNKASHLALQSHTLSLSVLLLAIYLMFKI